MNNLQQKLDFLLEKYSVEDRPVLKNDKEFSIGDKVYPVLSHRTERKFTELKNIVNNGTLEGVSVMRTVRIVEKNKDIYEELYREIDICRYVLQKEMKSVMVYDNGNVLNAILSADDDIVCTIEIAATLNEGDIPKEKHEVIAKRGTACDIVVDSQIRQDSIYIFGENNEKYTDVDFELYGLSYDEINTVRNVFFVSRDKEYDNVLKNHTVVSNLVDLAKKSAKSGEREVVR